MGFRLNTLDEYVRPYEPDRLPGIEEPDRLESSMAVINPDPAPADQSTDVD